MSLRDEARECLADECVESLWASRSRRRYSSPPLPNGKGVILSASGTAFNSTHDSIEYLN